MAQKVFFSLHAHGYDLQGFRVVPISFNNSGWAEGGFMHALARKNSWGFLIDLTRVLLMVNSLAVCLCASISNKDRVQLVLYLYFFSFRLDDDSFVVGFYDCQRWTTAPVLTMENFSFLDKVFVARIIGNRSWDYYYLRYQNENVSTKRVETQFFLFYLFFLALKVEMN